MTVLVGVLTGRVEAAPGEVAAAQVALRNDGTRATTVEVRVVGLDNADERPGAGGIVTVALAPGAETTCLVPLVVPAGLGIGEHSAGIQVVSDRPEDRPTLATFTVSIGSVERVELNAVPSTLRGLRRTKLRVDVGNYEPVPVTLELSAEAPDVSVRFRHPQLRVMPGQHAIATGRVKGPRMWVGEPTQHNLVITGRGHASATSTRAVFVQRPLFARRLRGAMVGLLVIALWLGAVGGFAWWWRERGQDAADSAGAGTVREVDTDGDGIPDLFITADGRQITGDDTDGDGQPDAFFDENGNPVPDPRGDAAEGADADGSSASGSSSGDGERRRQPTSAVVRGTVKAPGALDDIAITLTPIDLTGGATPDPSALVGGPGRSLAMPRLDAAAGTQPDQTTSPAGATVTKWWPAREVAPGGALDTRRQTEAIEPLATNPQADGVWLFTDVALRQSYEVVFAKPGFDTQSFVVTPPEDGSAVELDVELEPAEGSLAGRVTGPGGPLGGVEITITDGTLTFTTTSATVGDVGTWSLEQVSTPGVYTVIGTLRGYGTEVRQVTLSPGQQFTGADLAMRPGVGSIAGRVVGPDGTPLGGVTVTAESGDQSSTTSTLTDGDVGYFHLPRLTSPADYTVRVQADGYITQTRRIDLRGALDGVDFTMVRTTLALTGKVTSSDGSGIPNAGLTLTTGDLTFKASTAGGQNAGNFVIENLPPGTYTVQIAHYLHHSATEFVTLTAGVTPPPLDVVLEPSGGLAAIGTGSLVVEVVDPTAETTAQREIRNATVRLVHTQTGQELPPVTQEAFDFQIDDIPVGTYTLYVTAPRYNPAPARQVSIGLSEERVQVELLRLGQASGRIVDSLTDGVLTDYFVSLYRQPESAGDAPVFTLPSRADGTWQTPPDSLIPGTYRIEVTDNASPAGYLVRPDQLLDTDVVGATPNDRFMRFVLPGDAVDPVVVADIEADRYPVLSGDLYKPAADGVDPDADPDRVALDSGTVSVTVTCSDAGAPFTAPLTDTGAPGADGFSITPEQVDSANLTGDCTITAEDAGRSPATVALAAVDASNGNTVSDRRVHLVLVPTAPPIGGSVFWLDGSQRRTLSGVEVSALAITEFPSQEGSDPAAPRSGNLSTTSAGNGDWDLDGQVYGDAHYSFDSNGQFDDATVTIRVDDGGANAIASEHANVTELASGRFEVELAAPTPRDLIGHVDLLTTTAPANLDDFVLTATAPDGSAVTSVTAACDTDAAGGFDVTIVRTPSPTRLDFRICNANPGTWEVAVTEPAHFDFFSSVTGVDRFVSAAADDGSGSGPDFDLMPNATDRIELVELARVELTLTNADGTAPVDLEPDVLLDGGAVALAPGSDDNVFVIEDVAVTSHPADPVSVPRTHALGVSLDEFDVSAAVVLVDGVPLADLGSDAFNVAVLAGETVEVEVRLPAYGSITGTVDGDLGDFVAGQPVDMAGGTVTVTPVDASGITLPGATPFTVATTGSSFTFSRAPGYYKVEVSHSNYTTGTIPVDEDDQFDGGPPVTSPVAVLSPVGIFRMVNDRTHTLDPFVLNVRPGALDLSVFTTLTGAPASCNASVDPRCVSDATYELVPTGRTEGQAGNPAGPVAGGYVRLDDLAPGGYTLYLRKVDPVSGDQIAFPLIVWINIGLSTAGTQSTVTLRAPLPPKAPSVSGNIVARNGLDGNIVELPAPVPGVWDYEVQITYPIPVADVVEGTATPQPSDPAVLGSNCSVAAAVATCTAIATGTYAGGTIGYRFDDVPFGSHTVTLSAETVSAVDALGYSLSGSSSTSVVVNDVTGDNPVAVDFRFDADPVDVTVTLGPAEQTFDHVTASMAGITGVPAGNTVTFRDVPPQLPTAPYTLTADADLHAPYTGTVAVVPSASGTGTPAMTPTTMTPDKARIIGTVGRIDTDGGTAAALGSGSSITLLGGPAVAPLPGVGLTSYAFDVDSAGSRTVRVAGGADYTETTSGPATLVLGQTAELDTTPIERLATIDVTVTNTPAPTGVQIELLAADDDQLAMAAGTSASFKAVPGDPVRVRVSAPGFPDLYEPVSGTMTPGIGATIARSMLLVPRSITVEVGNAPLPSGTSVKLTIGATTVTDSAAPFEFGSAATPPIPLTGAGTAVIEAPGYRALAVVVADGSGNYPVTIHPLATVSGTINAPDATAGDQVIKATSGSDTVWGSITGNTYTIDGLDVGVDGADRTWTLTYDKVGVGIGTTSLVVRSANVTGTTTITVAPQPIPVTFHATFSGGGANAAGVGIVFPVGGSLVVTGANGQTTGLTVLENATGALLDYAVTGNNFLVHPGGAVTLPTSARTPITVPVTVTARPPVAGTVTDAGVATTATVRVCSGTPTTCNSGAAVVSGSANSSGQFSLPSTSLVPGTYTVFAFSSGKSGSVTFVVNADRSHTGTAVSIPIA